MISYAVPVNGLKPESETTFNSEVTLFLAGGKKHFSKRAGWNEQFMHLQAGDQQPSICFTMLAVCCAWQQVSELQHLAQLLF